MTKTEKSTKLSDIHFRGFMIVLKRFNKEASDRKPDIYKAIYHGVSFGAVLDEKQTALNPEELFAFFESVNTLIGILTPIELTGIFPIDKIYDGAKWQLKDYFSTMDALNKYGMDKPIGENYMQVLWTYTKRCGRILSILYDDCQKTV